MGVLRLPRPTGIYVPSSPTRTLTADMISPPLSPSFNFDSETVTPSVIPALEYISSKLQQKMMHVTLLVGRGKPYPTGQTSDLMVIPITQLDPQSQAWRTLHRTIAKGARKFSLGQSWADALTRSQHERHANEYLIQQSILQNEVIFSSEGLTLLNVDRIYTFKRRLCILSNRDHAPQDAYISSCVTLLHRTILDFQGRPFSKAFFHRVYEQLDVRDDLLACVAAEYKLQHGQEGIVLPPRPRAEMHVRKSPIRATRVRRQQPPPPKFIGGPTKRGPKTPLSASDVTPITRNEWNILVGSELHKMQPTVTKWTPSPTVYAIA
ncbi:hypothetical protein ASPWEDRAFT_44988 [Aspergillus wentii DTO 134E9]|uniref:DUF7582 domain-containing protein n=1 Tax=Aspergillus wentii DTO 134E9 TaxID=1073089 RepID=A0A1L9R7Z4_ASPWE|nr:uncharacterized protein ASPWEDRAFT_44988 [Aspergillus wentii DTO 134E9]KAI9927662.1 hypothetical protein MW887_003283 [Aspergillus wentii]OJJ31042.1 hypothetical protein ASPWEDRAFT_44988 [Aspergillus wentii DTO 134E9]